MKSSKLFITILFIIATTFTSHAQLGIRAGLNMASEITSFNNDELSKSFKTENFNGYQIGLVYQTYTKGLGFEIGALLSQKGSMYQIDTTLTASSNLTKAYKEINCITMPLNLRYRIPVGPIDVFVLAGIYGDYALNGKTVIESINYERNIALNNIMDRIDYGYTLGFGVEAIKKIQLALNWSRALQKKDASKSFTDIRNFELNKSTSNIFSVNLTYLF